LIDNGVSQRNQLVSDDAHHVTLGWSDFMSEYNTTESIVTAISGRTRLRNNVLCRRSWFCCKISSANNTCRKDYDIFLGAAFAESTCICTVLLLPVEHRIICRWMSGWRTTGAVSLSSHQLLPRRFRSAAAAAAAADAVDDARWRQFSRLPRQ